MKILKAIIGTLVCLTGPAAADGTSAMETLVRPGFAVLATKAAQLADAARQDCDPRGDLLRAAYDESFDAWISVSHLRFGPSEDDDRAFALAFWPDTRGATPHALGQLIADRDAIVASPDEFAEVSIAARGFYALEFLLYDQEFVAMPSDYTCALIQAVTVDIAQVSEALAQHWAVYAPSDPDASLFNAVLTGLEFTANARLGRPLGTFDRPRPRRAEAWRSGRSMRHVILSLVALKSMAIEMARDDTVLVEDITAAFDRAIAMAEGLDDPVFAGVTDPQNRLRIEILQNQVLAAHQSVRDGIGPLLGVMPGFNALDGD